MNNFEDARTAYRARALRWTEVTLARIAAREEAVDMGYSEEEIVAYINAKIGWTPGSHE